jgi:hypothetical protein
MARPTTVTDIDIVRWDSMIDSDDSVPDHIKSSLFFRELMRAGVWLMESLEQLGCPSDLITRIQFTAGRYSFGRDAWDAHIEILNAYKNNELLFAEDPDELN